MPMASMVSAVSRMPAVSMKRKVVPAMLTVSSMVSRVVPAMSDVAGGAGDVGNDGPFLA